MSLESNKAQTGLLTPRIKLFAKIGVYSKFNYSHNSFIIQVAIFFVKLSLG